MLTSDYNTVVEDNLKYADGFQLYATIASIDAREENPNLAATKLSYK